MTFEEAIEAARKEKARQDERNKRHKESFKRWQDRPASAVPPDDEDPWNPTGE